MAQSDFTGSEVTGKWNLTIELEEGEFPAWIEINRSGLATLTGSYVGYEGSARPISEVKYSEGDQTYSFSIPPQWTQLNNDLRFEFTLQDNKLTGITFRDDETLPWTAVRAPALVRDEAPIWGNPINLLDQNMSKWIIADNNKFQMQNGVLVNGEVGGNLVTAEKFNDFKLQVEFRYPEGSNSGLYLRGRYEAQIMDQYGSSPYKQSIGGIYGHIAPSINAAKEANEWQTLDITLVGRMVTIVLNGVEVVTNRLIPGMTGGALDNNEDEPGPLMIQGDHGQVEFRKMIITPSVN